jgi:hypothetical protein
VIYECMDVAFSGCEVYPSECWQVTRLAESSHNMAQWNISHLQTACQSHTTSLTLVSSHMQHCNMRYTGYRSSLSWSRLSRHNVTP